MKTIEFEGKNYNVFSIDTPYGHEDVICVPRKYRGGELAIEIISLMDNLPVESYAVLTVNIDCYTGARTQSDTRAYVDTNNNDHWGCRDFIKKYNLEKPTGKLAQSGFCIYPLYEFNLNNFYAK